MQQEKESSPIELLLLVETIHCLGWGWTFDDAEDKTGVSEEA
jgi:hypothetical protein